MTHDVIIDYSIKVWHAQFSQVNRAVTLLVNQLLSY